MTGAEGPAARSPRLCCVRKGGPAPSGDLGCETDAVTETVPGTVTVVLGGGVCGLWPLTSPPTPQRERPAASQSAGSCMTRPREGWGAPGHRVSGARVLPSIGAIPVCVSAPRGLSCAQLSHACSCPAPWLGLAGASSSDSPPRRPPVASTAPPPPPTASSRLCTPAGPVGSRSRQASHRGPGNAEGARELDLCWDASQPLSQGQPPLHLVAPGTP